MRIPLRLRAVVALLAAAGVAAPGLARAQESKTRKEPPKRLLKGEAKGERVSGVIIKVEDVPRQQGSGEKSETKGRLVGGKRLTINTAAVWDDWVRDQAPDAADESPEEAAKQGANSIATEGQPASPDTLATVDVSRATEIETRYRSSTDQASEGAKTPEGAAEAQEDPADATSKGRGASGKDGDAKQEGERFDLADLKPGLFVDVEFRHAPSQNRATRVVVLRPVGGPQSPAGEVAPEPKAAKKKAKGEKKAPRKQADDQ